MIGITQTTEEKDEKIAKFSNELRILKFKHDEQTLQLGTLSIHHEKTKEHLTQLLVQYDDTVAKLHKMNKARHDLETKLTDEIERNRSLADIVKLKEESIL